MIPRTSSQLNDKLDFISAWVQLSASHTTERLKDEYWFTITLTAVWQSRLARGGCCYWPIDCDVFGVLGTFNPKIID